MPFDWISQIFVIGYSNPVIKSAILGLIRSILGWLYNALEDWKITRPELSQLGATVARTFLQVLGWESLGAPGEVALLSDMIFTRADEFIKALQEKK